MSRPDLSGTTIAGKFELQKRLGSGYFGDVYRARHKILDEISALKVIPVDYSKIDQTGFEATIQNATKHDRAVKVISAEHWSDPKGQDHILINMPFIDGGSLQDKIEAGLTLSDAIAFHKDVLFAVEHLHRLGYVHRDIKPKNILISNHALLSDFGIAMLKATGATPSFYTYAGNKAPECFSLKTYDNLTDIFASGLSLFRAVNNIADWNAARAAVQNWQDKAKAGELISAIGYRSYVPRRIRLIIGKACHPDPAQRYPSAAKMRDALEKIQVIRNWIRVSSSEYTCAYLKKQERVWIEEKLGKFAVYYTVSGRHQRSFEKSGLNLKVAQAHMGKLMSDFCLK